MKQIEIFLKIFMMTTCLFYSDVINAYDFEVDGIYYNKTIVSLSNNQHTINSINKDTNVEIEFESIQSAIDITQYISAASTGGSIIQTNNLINSGSQLNWVFANKSEESVTLNSLQLIDGQTGKAGNIMTVDQVVDANSSVGYSTTIGSTGIHTPVTCRFSYTYNGTQYSIDAIYSGTQTYTLSIKASGNGQVSYNGYTIRNNTKTFSVERLSSVTLTIIPDDGYKIKSVKVNNSDFTSSVVNNSYQIYMIMSDKSVEVEFEPIPTTTYTLSVTSMGGGYASYNSTNIRGKTSSFTVNRGNSATIYFYPDDGYRIKSVVVDGYDVTSSVWNNEFTVSNISSNTNVEVVFEAIPPTTYTLSVKATGNGSATYDGTIVRGKTSTFTVNEGTDATITFSPDYGYRIKNVVVDGYDVTSSIWNDEYTVSNISSNTTVEVVFESIPPTTYTLSIMATGNGSVSYDGTSVRGKTSSFTVVKGTNVTITFTPDDGYKIKTVKVNSTDVTSNVSNNSYTVGNISGNTTVEVEFEAIPVANTCTFTIIVSGNGSALFDNETIRNSTKDFTVNIGTSVTVYFSADSGYEVTSLKVNNGKVNEKKYCTITVSQNTVMEVEFGAIQTTTYTLSIKATGNGTATYDGTAIRDNMNSFTVTEGTNATITFTPDNGYQIKSLKVNSTDVTLSISNNSYTVNNISKDTTVEVEFAEELKAFTSNDVNYAVSSFDNKTIIVAGGNYSQVLEVPTEVIYQDIKWKVVGIDNAALEGKTKLAAIIWNPSAEFTLSVSNPNLLLYVTSANYAPASITNVIVSNTASKIVLTDATSGNDFYCPREFTAKSISYTHNYGMMTGKGESRGWETIALPFDVEKITHSSKGEITPFANWKNEDSKKPFWLMTYGTGGWTEANSIKAYTPYIISMPNHSDYKSDFRLSGSITFSAENVTVKKTDNLQTGSYNGKTLRPNFTIEDNNGCYALNVNNDYVAYNGGANEGSTFVLNLRPVRPFEAYMTTTSNFARSIAISDDMTTGIKEVMSLLNEHEVVRVYNLQGQQLSVEAGKNVEDVKRLLPAGVYIINGKKQIIK